jgi:hypothetical protein
MEDMQNFHGICHCSIEDQIVAMDPPSDSVRLPEAHQWKAIRALAIGKGCFAKLLNEVYRPRRVVLGDPVSNIFKILFSRLGEDDFHCLDFAICRYLASNRSKTSSAGFTLPAFAAASPRSRDLFRALSLCSRSCRSRSPSLRTSLFELYRPLATSDETNFSSCRPRSTLLGMDRSTSGGTFTPSNNCYQRFKVSTRSIRRCRGPSPSRGPRPSARAIPR